MSHDDISCQVNPAHAEITGRAFGDGLYLADMYDKSSSYTRGSGGREYLLLCEADLGKCLKVDKLGWGNIDEIKQKSEKYDSVHVVGMHMPEVEGEVVTREGYTVPLGKVVRKKENETNWYSYQSIKYSEYIVKDETKVRVRFILKIGPGSADEEDEDSFQQFEPIEDNEDDSDDESFGSSMEEDDN